MAMQVHSSLEDCGSRAVTRQSGLQGGLRSIYSDAALQYIIEEVSHCVQSQYSKTSSSLQL